MVVKKREIRSVVIDTLIDLAKERSDIVVLDADVSKSTRTRVFGKQFPDRFFNVGVAEMNLAGIAAGLATTGKTPFISSFAVFLALRALEPIRTMISYPNLNVKLIGGYSGLTAHQHGPTHHCLRDVAMMRALPNFTVLSPSDWVSAGKAVEVMASCNGPVYLRLGYVNEENIYSMDLNFDIGKAFTLKEGENLTFLTTGLVTRRVLEVANDLEKEGLSARVIDCPTIKPLDENAILSAAEETGKVITVEEHSVIGGFGSAVAELLIQKCPIPMRILGVGDIFTESAPYPELIDAYGLSKTDITNAARSLVSNAHKPAEQI